jgi:hypothetical protein
MLDVMTTARFFRRFVAAMLLLAAGWTLSAAQAELIQDAATSQPASRPATQQARITYELINAGDWPEDIRTQIVTSMDEAIAVYHQHTTLRKHVRVHYKADVPTAHANYNGNLTFGKQRGTRTALHELGHVFGVGTTRQWAELLADGKWTGPTSVALLKQFDGPDAVLYGDARHFWPYGLNYDREMTPNSYEYHARMVQAINLDMKLPESR